MFFNKTERKPRNTRLILAVGALAAIGAIRVFKYGKQMASDALGKVKGFFKSEKIICSEKADNQE